MSNSAGSGEFDLFLSHASPDKSWVLELADHLGALGLRVFVDEREITVGDNFVLRLSDGLARSRYMVLVLSKHTEGRDWVNQEWTSFVAGHSPMGRLLPVKIDAVELPFILKATQATDAIDRDAERVAGELFKVVGDPSTLQTADARRLVLGRDMVFALTIDKGKLNVVRPDGSSRTLQLPWDDDGDFALAHFEFGRLHRKALTEAPDRADLFRHARTLGSELFETLFDAEDAKRLEGVLTPDRERPVVQIRSDDDRLLSLPWELLHYNKEFLVREGRLDLVRTTLTDVAGETLLREPKTAFKLVVNVSAPEDSQLRYEAESYRITLATAERCVMVPTELGTLKDLVDTVDAEDPTGIHFSGHGLPGALLFEDDEGRGDSVEVSKVVKRLRDQIRGERRLPPFFYLASCHGNDPVSRGEERSGAPSAAVQLHKAGVTEVVGYFGPIVDELSTRAEETIYEAIAEGRSTREAVRLARQKLKLPFYKPEAGHRPSPTRSDVDGAQKRVVHEEPDTHPFAWAQLVFYRRGPEWPLSIATPKGKRRATRRLQRRFEGFGDRKVLKAGFVGRRLEQHKIRRRIRRGDRVFVLQGLGGLGKSTLAQRVIPWLADDPANVCTLWCQGIEGEKERAKALVDQLVEYCRARFGPDWEVVQRVDHAGGDDPAKRFLHLLGALVQSAPGLVLHLDNLESLLIGPKDDADPKALGRWAEPALKTIWKTIDEGAREGGAFYLIASCRYRNKAFANALLPVTPLAADALFRLTEWHPALERLTSVTRARLVSGLDGHPRAVEYANDLVEDALTKWRDTQGEWAVSVPPKAEEIEREWQEIVEPCLPQVEEKLTDNLLLQALWDRVLEERARRFLYRMTVLRRPAQWDLIQLLGEPNESPTETLETAERLRDTSLIEQVELRVRVGEGKTGTSTRYSLHPATARFIAAAHDNLPELRIQAHRRLGEHLEAAARKSVYIETTIEAGHHLLEAGEHNRAYKLMGAASGWLQERGSVRQALRLLEPFLEESVRAKLDRKFVNQLMAHVGIAHFRLGEVRTAVEYHERALAIAQEIGYRQGELEGLGNLGNTYLALGEVDEAIKNFDRTLVIARELKDFRSHGASLGNLGLCYLRLGEVRKAMEHCEAALTVARKNGDRPAEVRSLSNLGIAYARLNRDQEAIKCYEQQLTMSREIGDAEGVLTALTNLGNFHAGQGDIHKAINYYEQNLVIAREIGFRLGESRGLANLGVVYMRLGEIRKSIDYSSQALALAREMGDLPGQGKAMCNLGCALAEAGEIQEATALLEHAKAIGERTGDPALVELADRNLKHLAGQ